MKYLRSEGGDRKTWNVNIIALISIIILLALLKLHFVYGRGIGLKIFTKSGYTFTDTFVSTRRILGTPLLLLQIQHPELMKRLEEEGIIESLKAKTRAPGDPEGPQ